MVVGVDWVDLFAFNHMSCNTLENTESSSPKSLGKHYDLGTTINQRHKTWLFHGSQCPIYLYGVIVLK